MATFVADKVPKSFTDARTAHPVFQDSIKGLQRFYWKQSLIKTVDGKEVLFISPQAVMENYLINGRIFLNSVMKCNDIELEILNALKAEGVGARLTRKQIAKVLRGMSVNIRDSMIAKHLQNLEEMNYVEVATTGSTKHYSINHDANMEGFHIKGKELLEHCRIVMERIHPEHYDEYCEFYLDRPTFIHPFTGKVIDLRSFEIGTKPKTLSNNATLEAPETFTDIDAGITADVMMDTVSDEDEVVEDMNDQGRIGMPEDDLKQWLKGNSTMYTDSFIDKFGEDSMKKVLDEGEAFQPNSDTIAPLN